MTNSLRTRVLATAVSALALVGTAASAAGAADHRPEPPGHTVIMSNEQWDALHGLGLPATGSWDASVQRS
ncbi:hypothetical protein ACYBSK_35290 [Streptomyces sp. BYX5S]